MTLASLGDCCLRSPLKLKIFGDPIKSAKAPLLEFLPLAIADIEKKGLFEFPRKGLLLYQGEEVYTKIAIR